MPLAPLTTHNDEAEELEEHSGSQAEHGGRLGAIESDCRCLQDHQKPDGTPKTEEVPSPT